MLIGHQRIWDYLIKSVKRDRLAHAYLFAGPAQVGKMALAMEFVKWLFCENNNFTPTHFFKRRGGNTELSCGKCRQCLSIECRQNPDIFILSAKQTDKNDILKNAEIGIDEIRDLQHRLSLSVYGNLYKVAIIGEAAALSGEAASALLKTLEEPSRNSLIILISSSWQAVLPTIVSRCQLIKFLLVPEREMTSKLKNLSKKEVNFERIMKLSAGRPGLAIKLLREPDLLAKQDDKIKTFEKILSASLVWRLEQAAELSKNVILAQEAMDLWQIWLRDRILEISGQPDLIVGSQTDRKYSARYPLNSLVSACRDIQKTGSILVNSSFNARLALEVLMTKI